MKYIDWVNLTLGVIGGVMITGLLNEVRFALDAPHKVWIYTAIVISVVVLMLVIYQILGRKGKLDVRVDERTGAISDKNARNTLLVTYVGLWLLVVIFDIQATLSLLIVISAGMAVFILSTIIYYVRAG